MRPSLDHYVGIPFVDGGRDVKGIDCWGLVKLYHHQQFDNILPDFDISSSDARAINGAMTSKEELAKWISINPNSLLNGDVIAMSMSNKHLDFVTHVGVYAGNGRFLHAIEGAQSALCQIHSPMWINRIRGFYRWAT